MLSVLFVLLFCLWFFQAEDGIRDIGVTGVQTCALPISLRSDPEPTRVYQGEGTDHHVVFRGGNRTGLGFLGKGSATDVATVGASLHAPKIRLTTRRAGCPPRDPAAATDLSAPDQNGRSTGMPGDCGEPLGSAPQRSCRTRYCRGLRWETASH